MRRPSASPVSTAPSSVTSVARDRARLDRRGQLPAVAGLLPVVAEDPRAPELLDRDLRLARPVGAHQAHVLSGPQRACGQQDLSARSDGDDHVGASASLRGATRDAELRAAARARSPSTSQSVTSRPSACRRSRGGAPVDAGADHGRRAARRRPSVSAARAAAAPVRSAVTDARVEDAPRPPRSPRPRGARARSRSAARAPDCPGTTSPISAAHDRRRAPASPGSRRPDSS